MKIIIATTSINRKKLFQNLGIAYQAVASDYEENIQQNQSTTEQVKIFAQGKAQSVHQKISPDPSEDFCIIGFDSMVDFQGKSIGKPKNAEEAKKQIQIFRGKTQHIISGISLIGRYKNQAFQITRSQSTQLTFRKDFTDTDIQKYLTFDDWQGKCGSYSILGPGIFFLQSIEGDFQNIIGVPVMLMHQMLEEVTGKKIWDLIQKSQ